MNIILKIKRLNPEVPIPHYAHNDDAACDLYTTDAIAINPGERVQIGTGIAMEIPDGYVGFVWDKSGLSHKHGLKTLGGVIDAGYRGEIVVGVINLSDSVYTLKKHHKVAQFIIQKKETVQIVEVDNLSDSARGNGGFGSTGK